MRHRTLVAVATTLALTQAAPATAAEDPERNASAPTGWHWWRGQSPTQLEQREQAAGERVIALNVDDSHGNRLSATLVKNSGAYQRDGDWFHHKTADEVVALTKGEGRRLVDLEPHGNFGQQRFAGVTVPNSGASSKSWWWNYDLSADDVTKEINKHKIRLVDLSVYKRYGKRRFAYVGIKNTGEDARKWWWYPDASPEFVKAKAKEHGARLIDIERHRSGTQTVVMVKNEGVFSRHIWNVSRDTLVRYFQSNALRITDLERHGDRYWATLIDNATAENARIRSIIRSGPYRDSYFGAFAKQTAGATHVGLAHQSPYQPMSVLKLVPHLYVMDRLDAGEVDLESDISWQSPTGMPDVEVCPGNTVSTSTYTDTLRNTLARGLGESLNRAHESLLNTYTPEAISARMNHPDIGLNSTELYHGCQHPGKKNWLSNRSTLTDMGELFEGVDTRKFFPADWYATRKEFYGLVADWPTDWLRSVVADEAATLGKTAIVDDFMSRVTFDAKGGGVDNGSDADGWISGRALSYRITLPFKGGPVRRGAGPEMRSFVGGFFANDISGPCHEGEANKEPDSVSDDCRAWAKAMGDTFRKLPAEVQRLPIRDALKTW